MTVSLHTVLEESTCSARLTDDTFAYAYKATGSQGRARLKRAIAFLYALWQGRYVKQKISTTYPNNIWLEVDTVPAEYVIVLCPTHYAWAERFLAACLPALCAQVEVIPLFYGESAKEGEIKPDLLCALELAGVEAAYALPYFLAVEKLRHGALTAHGRVVFMGEPVDYAPIAEICAVAAIPSMVLRATVMTEDCHKKYVVQGGKLCLQEGESGLWVWPHLSPEWFMEQHICCTMDTAR